MSASVTAALAQLPDQIAPLPDIQMVDLKRQYARLKADIDAEMAEVLASTAFINGPQVGRFAEKLSAYLGGPHVIPCANGTDALQLALMALGLKPGDEVIVPAFNYVATAEVIALLGLTPVFVDVEPEMFSISPAAARAAVTERTRAIMPVHLFGQAAEMDAIMRISLDFGLHVIEDNAQAIGTEVTYQGRQAIAGTIGAAGTTSFFPSKNLGCMGDGGAVYTTDADLAHVVRQIANHGQARKYHYDRVGVNSRLDTLQAAILLAKLPHLTEFTATRQAAAARYDAGLAGIPGLHTPARAPWSTHVFHQYTIRVEGGRREELKKHLEAAGIPTMVYYPAPLHLQKAFAYLGKEAGAFPIAERLATEVLSLPIHSEITEAETDYICAQVRAFFAS